MTQSIQCQQLISLLFPITAQCKMCEWVALFPKAEACDRENATVTVSWKISHYNQLDEPDQHHTKVGVIYWLIRKKKRDYIMERRAFTPNHLPGEGFNMKIFENETLNLICIPSMFCSFQCPKPGEDLQDCHKSKGQFSKLELFTCRYEAQA